MTIEKLEKWKVCVRLRSHCYACCDEKGKEGDPRTINFEPFALLLFENFVGNFCVQHAGAEYLVPKIYALSYWRYSF